MEKAKIDYPWMKKKRPSGQDEDHTKPRGKKRNKRMKCPQGG